MDILVLGGTGVISRAIVREGLSKGHKMTVFNRGNRSVDFGGDVEVLKGDKKDHEAFRAIMKDRSFDAVIDVICYDEEDAKDTVDVFKDKAKHLIFTSSSAAYKRPYKSIPIEEDKEELDDTGVFPYGFKKANMERYLYTVMAEGIIPVTIIRPSLTFGEGCQNIGVLRQNVNIIDRILNGKKLVVPGDGTAVWAFTFAPDLAKAYILSCCNKNTYNKFYHVASEEAVLWKDLYNAFGKAVGKEPEFAYLPSTVLYKANPDMFNHFYFEKQYATLMSTKKFRADVPEFKIDISLEKGIESIIEYWEKADFKFDPQKDEYEDKLVEVYENLLKSVENL